MFHYIYKTVCSATGKYYIGMHSTDNLEDGYQGSGTTLKHSISKYGREAHKTEILEFCSDRKSLKSREREIVCEEVVGDKLCMNLRLGGEGWESAEASLAAAKGNRSEKRTRNPEWLKKISEHNRRTKNLVQADWTGRSHREDSKKKIGQANSIAQAGSKNSQHGKCWIFSDAKRCSMSIKKEDLEKFLSAGWMIGRKMKFSSCTVDSVQFAPMVA